MLLPQRAEVREAHTDVIMLANSVRELVHQQKQDKAGCSELPKPDATKPDAENIRIVGLGRCPDALCKEGRSLATGEPLNLMIVDSEVFWGVV